MVVHAVIGDPDAGGGDETLDPRRTLLSERARRDARRVGGRAASATSCPSRPSCPTRRPPACRRRGSPPTGCCSPRRGSGPGDRVLVQGAGGGVASAAIALGGRRRLSRDGRPVATRTKRDRARTLGAQRGLRPATGCPSGSTWSSRRSARPRGALAASRCARADGGGGRRDHGRQSAGRPQPGVLPAALGASGSTMGTRSELEALLRFLVTSGVRPQIDATYPLAEARTAFERLARGDQFGKIVLTALTVPTAPRDQAAGPSSAAQEGNCFRQGSRVSYSSSWSSPGQPGGQPLDRHLELGVEVDELGQPAGSQASETCSSPRLASSSSMPRSVKYTAVHVRSAAQSSVDQRGLLGLVHRRGPGRGRRAGAAGTPGAAAAHRGARAARWRCKGQPPMLAGSSWTQTTSSRLGVGGQRRVDLGGRQRVELLDP